MNSYKWKLLNDKEKEIIVEYYGDDFKKYNYIFYVPNEITSEYLNVNNNVLFLASMSCSQVRFYTNINITRYDNNYYCRFKFNYGYCTQMTNMKLKYNIARQLFEYYDFYKFMLINNLTHIDDVNHFIYNLVLLCRYKL